MYTKNVTTSNEGMVGRQQLNVIGLTHVKKHEEAETVLVQIQFS